MSVPGMALFLGLDLGQTTDPTALAVLRDITEVPPTQIPGWLEAAARQGIPGGSHQSIPGITPAGGGGGMRAYQQLVASYRGDPPPGRYECPHLDRLPLGTPYPAVVDRIQALLKTDELAGAELVVDATGVGRPVVDLMRQRGLEPVAITITGGDQTVWDHGGWRVPKRDLIASVQVLLQTERLKFAKGVPIVSTLVQELLAYRVKIDPITAHDSYGPWREGAHDDLLLAVAVAAWYAERMRPMRLRDMQPYTRMRSRI
jgi:hypothetical protein